MFKLKPKQLRTATVNPEEKQQLRKNPIYLILDNVLDTYNVGAIFRLADALAVEKVFLCGETEIPPNTRIKKASINTTEWVEWEYVESTVKLIKNLKLKIENLQVLGVEQDAASIPYQQANYNLPIALVVGNETTGISKEVLKVVDQIVELPMWGVNTSLNVMVSLAIVLYKIAAEKFA